MLTDLAIILCVAALTTVIFQCIRQPVVLGYLLAGMIVGPHLPIPLFANEEVAHTLSELGVLLLMFALGLEFSLTRLRRIAATAGAIATIQCSVMLLLGHLTGRLLGFRPVESLFMAATITISSTTIIVKAFEDRGIKGELAEMVFGVLIVEDIVGILLLAILTTLGNGVALTFASVAVTLGKLVGFIAILLAAGMLVVPRVFRIIVRQGRKETIVVANVGLCFGVALLARAFGYSVALGAFFAGALVAESGEAKSIESLIEPVRDVFAAVFFVSVGMLIDPAPIAQHWLMVLVLTVVVVAGKIVGVSAGSFLAGYGVYSSVRAGMSLAQIGEFSFIIAGLGMSLGATPAFLYPVIVAVSAITTLLTPWLIRTADTVAGYLDQHLPRSLQTYAALYGSWVEGLRGTRGHVTAWAKIRRLVWQLGLDLVVFAAIAIAGSLGSPRVLRTAHDLLGLAPVTARILFFTLVAIVLLPFLLGAIRLSRALGVALAAEALPVSPNGLDLADASRRALLVGLQITILLAVGGPLVTILQPFYPRVPGAVLLLVLVLLLIYPLWRSADNVYGHARAGAQVILEALASMSEAPATDAAQPSKDEKVPSLVPGLGNARTVRLAEQSSVVGRTLKEIALRARSGATVIAIQRASQETVYPSSDETLRAEDVLVLTGTKDSVRVAEQILSYKDHG